MIFAIFLQSCKTADCPSCSENTRVSHPKLIEWKVALNSEYYDENTKTTIMSVSTDIEPTFIPTINPDSRECGNIPTWDGMPWESYFQKNHFKNLKGIIRIIGYPNESGVSPIYSIPASNIAEITSTSNPLLLPPHEYVIKEPCLCCDRIRKDDMPPTIMLIWSSILNRFLAALILISAAFACQPRRKSQIRKFKN